ncbi:peptidoglycan DD-metalloendopeptidase family protein [Winogradskyella flava]|uniref:Peptidoglycan DD-metalloendopeptidase family protein n=1 Tax=Winogradskyella flava TaxID=1884876 RepID=A0A842ISD3_9FLAO|nr:peptidoglycan DD-metalloendopeptidase family protein [Winogradskyella flava]MBC2846082.1 peptidoglycan DD-metalloendopeptidase family protein [Winogradskyella flava]
MSLSSFQAFLKSLSTFPLLGDSMSKEDYIALDLSVNNSDLKSVNVSSSIALEVFIWDFMAKHNAKASYGGYLEQRSIYRRSDYFNQDTPEEERNIHLGLDLWIEASAPIFSPLDAKIHSFRNNTNYGDYGPTIILEHNLENNKFYTLYGHLSLESLVDLKVGKEIKQGQQIATLGTAEVNGDYPPHLHFQIIKDIQEFEGDYPGVSNHHDLEFYKENCPDPGLLLGLF